MRNVIWPKVLILTLIISLLSGTIATTFGLEKAEAGVLDKAGGFLKNQLTKLFSWTKKNPGKTTVAIAGLDLFLNDGKFLGATLEWVLGGVAGTVEKVLQPPQELIFNYYTVEHEDGTKEALFKDKDHFPLYIFSQEMWEVIKGFYYFFSSIFWSALVVVIIVYALRMASPTSGVLDVINAKDIIGISLLAAAALFFMPYMVDLLSDLSILLVGIASNIPDPQLIVDGLLAYETGHGLVDALFHLIALSQIGLLNLIYFLRDMTLFGLIVFFPIVLIINMFPSKRHLLPMWNKEMLANLFLQPLHAFLFSFAFLFLQEADDIKRYVLSSFLLIAIIPSGMILRAVFRAHMVGSNWVTKAVLSGTGLAGMAQVVKMIKDSAGGFKDVYQDVKQDVQTQGGLSNALRKGFNFTTSSLGAVTGLALAGIPGAKIGSSVAGWAGNKVSTGLFHRIPEMKKKMEEWKSPLNMNQEEVSEWKNHLYQKQKEHSLKNSAVRFGQAKADYEIKKQEYAQTLHDYVMATPDHKSAVREKVIKSVQDMDAAKRNLTNIYRSVRGKQVARDPGLAAIARGELAKVRTEQGKVRVELAKQRLNHLKTNYTTASKKYVESITALPKDSNPVIKRLAEQKYKLQNIKNGYEEANKRYVDAPLGSVEKAQARKVLLQMKKSMAATEQMYQRELRSPSVQNLIQKASYTPGYNQTRLDYINSIRKYNEASLGSTEKAQARKHLVASMKKLRTEAIEQKQKRELYTEILNQAIESRAEMIQAERESKRIESELKKSQRLLGGRP
jgi:hypothetical protein